LVPLNGRPAAHLIDPQRDLTSAGRRLRLILPLGTQTVDNALAHR
jgi:hypothetical protein